MRRSDIGPFGVVTLLLALLLQTAALAAALGRGVGPGALVVALVVSRLVLPVLCSRGVPAARADGLGRTVAGTVSRPALLLSAGLAVLALLGAGAVTGLLPAGTGPLRAVAWWVLAVPVPLLVAGLLALRCTRRLGGITGDVLGACVEVACTASLVLPLFV